MAQMLHFEVSYSKIPSVDLNFTGELIAEKFLLKTCIIEEKTLQL